MVYGPSRVCLVDFWAEIWLSTILSAVSWTLSGRKGRRKPLKDPLPTKFRPRSRPTNPKTALNHICLPLQVPARRHLRVFAVAAVGVLLLASVGVWAAGGRRTPCLDEASASSIESFVEAQEGSYMDRGDTASAHIQDPIGLGMGPCGS